MKKTAKRIIGIAVVTLLIAVALVGAGAATTYEVGDDKTYKTLSEALSSGTVVGGDTLKLTSNIVDNITIGVDLTLDLNGYVVQGTGNGSVITINPESELTVIDSNTDNQTHKFTKSNNLWVWNDTASSDYETVTGGCITGGNKNGNGGGVHIDRSYLIIDGGNIVGNNAKGSGGGVYVGNYGYLYMSDGCIIGNTASDEGGGVYNKYFTSVYGGEIKNNWCSNHGGGVCNNYTMYVYEDPKIFGNSSGSGKADNLYMKDEDFYGVTIPALLYLNTSEGKLTPGAYIGVTTTTAPSNNAPVAIAPKLSYESKASADDVGYFFSDSSNSHVEHKGTKLYLVYHGSTPYYNITVADGITHGTVRVSTLQAPENTEITVTAVPDDGYEQLSVTVNGSSDSVTKVDDTHFKFVMPGSNVTVSATFKRKYVAENTSTGTKYLWLQEAINTANSGDTIKLIENTQENVTVDRPITLNMNGHVVAGSEIGKYTITITSAGDLSVPSTDVYGKINNEYGGGVYVDNDGKVTMGGCYIFNCKGSGVYVNGGTFKLRDGSSIHDCTAENGGGVYVGNGGTLKLFSLANIYNCTAENGGGVYVDNGGTFELRSYTSIHDCTAENGGGVYVDNGGTLELRSDSSIHDCTAENGGGVYVDTGGTFTINECTVSNCTPDCIYNNGDTVSSNSVQSSAVLLTASASADENVITEEISNPVGDEVSESSGCKVTISSGTIEGKVINYGDMEIDGDTKIDEICLPVGNKVTLKDLTNSAKVGIKFNGLESIDNPETLQEFIAKLKEYILIDDKDYIQNNVITCSNTGYKFAWDENDGGKPTLVDKNGKKVVEVQTLEEGRPIAVFTDNSLVSQIALENPVSEVTKISYIYGIGDAESELTDYQVLCGFRVLVNSDAGGTITFKADSSYPAGVRLMHYENREWMPLTTKVLGDGTYEADTPSFSPFAIVQYAEPAKSSSSVTSFSGTKDGSDFTFDRAVVITKATLPGATSATVTNTSGSGWYTCNLSSDGFSGNGVLYFQVPLDVIDIKGYTVNDVSMLGCKTTYLGTEGKYAKYSAVITKDGALTIDFEEDAATNAVEKVQEVVEQKQTEVEQKQAAAEKVQETVEKKQTATEQKQAAAKSPFPVFGILAGLCVAAFFLRRH